MIAYQQTVSEINVPSVTLVPRSLAWGNAPLNSELLDSCIQNTKTYIAIKKIKVDQRLPVSNCIVYGFSHERYTWIMAMGKNRSQGRKTDISYMNKHKIKTRQNSTWQAVKAWSKKVKDASKNPESIIKAGVKRGAGPASQRSTRETLRCLGNTSWLK